jgi:hypothetical protein
VMGDDQRGDQPRGSAAAQRSDIRIAGVARKQDRIACVRAVDPDRYAGSVLVTGRTIAAVALAARKMKFSDNVTHFTEEKRAKIISSYLAHERDEYGRVGP